MARHASHSSRAFPPTLKRLGQHFLVDDGILDRIADSLNITAEDTVVEIGPGRGALTDRLAARAKRVIAIELDRALAKMLREQYADQGNVEIVEADVLHVSVGELCDGEYLLAGNVPYYITTPILFHTLTPPVPTRSVFLIQREVAERAVAPHGNKTYGALSVNLQAVLNVEMLFSVPPGAFRPPPSVDSAIIRCTPLADPLVTLSERAKFQTFVQSAFGMRRKQILRVLRSVRAMEATEARDILLGLGIDPTVRPEDISPADFARLFRAVVR